MKKLNKLILLSFITFIGNAWALDAKQQHEISWKHNASVVINAFKQRNKTDIAELISYPLKRRYPIPAIKDKAEFLNRFNEVFDENFIRLIANSNLEADWKDGGWRGITFSRGKLWLGHGDEVKIIGINHQTLKEQAIKASLIEKNKQTLHPSIREYERPILEWQTAKFHIRIDQMGPKNYRYASWSVGNKVGDKPDLILLNGKVKYIGSGGNHHYSFINGNYTYRCDVTVIGKDDSPPGILSVFKGQERILSENVLIKLRQ